jgi:hypothetical protein
LYSTQVHNQKLKKVLDKKEEERNSRKLDFLKLVLHKIRFFTKRKILFVMVTLAFGFIPMIPSITSSNFHIPTVFHSSKSGGTWKRKICYIYFKINITIFWLNVTIYDLWFVSMENVTECPKAQIYKTNVVFFFIKKTHIQIFER